MTTLTKRGVGLAALVALVALGAACSGGPPAATASPAPTGGPRASSGAAGSASPASPPADPCASGGPQVILAARVGIGQRGRAPESWVDFEVRGPELDAQRFCDALVKREMSIVYPEETRLVARMERPCNATAMAEPKGTPPYLLADRRAIDATEAMLLGVKKGCSSGSAGVNATERRLTGFADEASCKQARQVILGGRRKAVEDAKAKAAEWLSSTLLEQEKRMAEACAAPRSTPCTEQKEIVRLLKDRVAKMAIDSVAADTSSDNPAGMIGGPVCRAR